MKNVKSECQKEEFPQGEGENQIVFRRWLVREIQSGRMSINEAVERFEFNSPSPHRMLRYWLTLYSSEVILTLPMMSEKERQKVEALQKQLKLLEKQLEDAQMKNVALETLIDVAEDQLKIKIRKKSGPKQ